MLKTLGATRRTLIAAFTYTTRLGSLQGDVMLAANGILFQLFSLASYGLELPEENEA